MGFVVVADGFDRQGARARILIERNQTTGEDKAVIGYFSSKQSKPLESYQLFYYAAQLKPCVYTWRKGEGLFQISGGEGNDPNAIQVQAIKVNLARRILPSPPPAWIDSAAILKLLNANVLIKPFIILEEKNLEAMKAIYPYKGSLNIQHRVYVESVYESYLNENPNASDFYVKLLQTIVAGENLDPIIKDVDRNDPEINELVENATSLAFHLKNRMINKIPFRIQPKPQIGQVLDYARWLISLEIARFTNNFTTTLSPIPSSNEELQTVGDLEEAPEQDSEETLQHLRIIGMMNSYLESDNSSLWMPQSYTVADLQELLLILQIHLERDQNTPNARQLTASQILVLDLFDVNVRAINGNNYSPDLIPNLLMSLQETLPILISEYYVIKQLMLSPLEIRMIDIRNRTDLFLIQYYLDKLDILPPSLFEFYLKRGRRSFPPAIHNLETLFSFLSGLTSPHKRNIVLAVYSNNMANLIYASKTDEETILQTLIRAFPGESAVADRLPIELVSCLIRNENDLEAFTAYLHTDEDKRIFLEKLILTKDNNVIVFKAYINYPDWKVETVLKWYQRCDNFNFPIYLVPLENQEPLITEFLMDSNTDLSKLFIALHLIEHSAVDQSFRYQLEYHKLRVKLSRNSNIKIAATKNDIIKQLKYLSKNNRVEAIDFLMNHFDLSDAIPNKAIFNEICKECCDPSKQPMLALIYECNQNPLKETWDSGAINKSIEMLFLHHELTRAESWFYRLPGLRNTEAKLVTKLEDCRGDLKLMENVLLHTLHKILRRSPDAISSFEKKVKFCLDKIRANIAEDARQKTASHSAASIIPCSPRSI